MTIDLPLPVSNHLAKSIAQYMLARYKNAAYRLQSIQFGDLPNARGRLNANLFSLDLGDVIDLSDEQLGLEGVRYRVVGIQGTLTAYKTSSVTFTLARLDDKTFWLVGHPAYGKLGSTTRLAI